MHTQNKFRAPVDNHVIFIHQYFFDLFIRVVVKDLIRIEFLAFREKLILLDVVVVSHLVSDENGPLENINFPGQFRMLNCEQ